VRKSVRLLAVTFAVRWERTHSIPKTGIAAKQGGAFSAELRIDACAILSGGDLLQNVRAIVLNGCAIALA
jgi:hypothetical protein